MSGHTKTPWDHGLNPTGWHSNEITIRPAGEFPHGLWVADVGAAHDTEAQANAAFVVRAVNAHDDLVAALTEAHSVLNMIRARDGSPQSIDWDRGRAMQTSLYDEGAFDKLTDQCAAALAKAKETP